MLLLDQKLGDAHGDGKRYVTVQLLSMHAPVAEVVEYAETLGWHVLAVWQGEANVTYILFRYEAP